MAREVLSILVDNHAGVLTRVASMFSRRGFNIDSLTVSATNDPKDLQNHSSGAGRQRCPGTDYQTDSQAGRDQRDFSSLPGEQSFTGTSFGEGRGSGRETVSHTGSGPDL